MTEPAKSSTTPGKGGLLSARRPSQANGFDKSLKDLQEDTIRFNMDIGKTLHKRLKLHSVTKDKDMTVLVREWIEAKLDEEGAPRI